MGSSASRKPSPSKFSDRDVSIMNIPGNTMRYGVVRMNSRASESSAPHSGVGSCTPNPRKLRLAAIRMSCAVDMVVWIVNSKSDKNYKVRDILYSTGDR